MRNLFWENIKSVFAFYIISQHWDDQSGTKPNLVAKILATKFGVFFVI